LSRERRKRGNQQEKEVAMSNEVRSTEEELCVRYTLHPSGWFDQTTRFKTEQEYRRWYAETKGKFPHLRVWRKNWERKVLFQSRPPIEGTGTTKGLRIISSKCDGSTDACILGLDY
jgi:hypothetical protein